MVAPDSFVACIAKRLHRRYHTLIQCGDGDLKINNVLGGESWNRGRTDVINSQCQVAQSSTKHGGDLLKLGLPTWFVRNDFNHGKNRIQ